VLFVVCSLLFVLPSGETPSEWLRKLQYLSRDWGFGVPQDYHTATYFLQQIYDVLELIVGKIDHFQARPVEVCFLFLVFFFKNSLFSC